MKRLLIRGANWLGDAVMSTPALLRLREAFPTLHLGVLTHENLADLWPHHPAIDSVLTFHSGEGLWSIARRLRRGRFDASLLIPNSVRSALEVWLAGIPRRVGASHFGRDRLLTDVVPRMPLAYRMRKRTRSEIQRRIAANANRQTYPIEAHHLFHYLRLASTLGASTKPLPPRLFLAPDEGVQGRSLIIAKTGQALAGSAPWLAVSPGAKYGPAKRWPVERFALVAQEISRRTGSHWLILGGGKDVESAEAIRARVPGSTNLCGQTTLRELMRVLSQCRLLLTNDTGPMHVAAALGVPVVVPFGSTSPELTGPGLPGDSAHRLLTVEAACAPCFLRVCPIDFRCMRRIREEDFIRTILELLTC